MKKLLITLVISCFLGATAYADTTSKATFDQPNAGFNQFLKDEVDHDHNYTDRMSDTEVGIGADVVVWENETGKASVIEEFVVEYRHDFKENNNTIYGVVRLNLWQKIKGIFGR